jgi:hypothetical protein
MSSQASIFNMYTKCRKAIAENKRLTIIDVKNNKKYSNKKLCAATGTTVTIKLKGKKAEIAYQNIERILTPYEE